MCQKEKNKNHSLICFFGLKVDALKLNKTAIYAKLKIKDNIWVYFCLLIVTEDYLILRSTNILWELKKNVVSQVKHNNYKVWTKCKLWFFFEKIFGQKCKLWLSFSFIKTEKSLNQMKIEVKKKESIWWSDEEFVEWKLPRMWEVASWYRQLRTHPQWLIYLVQFFGSLLVIRLWLKQWTWAGPCNFLILFYHTLNI